MGSGTTHSVVLLTFLIKAQHQYARVFADKGVNMDNAIESAVEVISSEGAFSVPDRGSRRKWDGPWWQLAILYEMGEVARIPRLAVDSALGQLKHGAWQEFVITEHDVPQTEADKEKMDCCHCELGVFYMILSACGCDTEANLPWIRRWFLKHQLLDGGLNCEPDAYLKSGKSSIVSSLPPLEAVLFFTDRDYTDAEKRFLDNGARYLIEHRLLCSKEGGSVINPEWLKPLFPRFFEYDILRGLHYLVEWSRRRGKPLPKDIIEEGIDRLKSFTRGPGIVIGRQVNDRNGDWHGSAFPLMESVSKVGQESPYLTKQLGSVLSALTNSA